MSLTPIRPCQLQVRAESMLSTLSSILVQSLVICQSFYNIIRKYLADIGFVLHFLSDQIIAVSSSD